MVQRLTGAKTWVRGKLSYNGMDSQILTYEGFKYKIMVQNGGKR